MHLPAIERSAGEAFRQIPDLSWIADDADQPVERYLELTAKGASWVVEKESRTIGFLNAEIIGSDFHIWELAVLRREQGHGIGRTLLEKACAWAVDWQIFNTTLTTFRGVRWNEPFYRSLGFRTLETADLDQRLIEILIREERAGLPRDRRCAMRRELRQRS